MKTTNTSITRLRLSKLCIATALLLTADSLSAQIATPDNKDRLARALKLYPDADTDKNGQLTMTEARAYIEKHPGLKAMIPGAASTEKKVTTKPAEFAPGAEGTRVFVCAHSYMIFTADTLPPVAQSAGVAHLKAGQQMIGGSRVIQHWNVPDEYNEAKKALREGRVDVLALSPHLLLPDEGIDLFTKLGLKKNPKLRVLVQVSWVPWDGRAAGTLTNAMRDAVTSDEVRAMRNTWRGGWLRQVEAQVKALNDATGTEAVRLIPVGAAVYALRELVAEGKAPGLARQSELFRDDHGHPSEVLALLVTYCHFAAIYQRTPVGLPVPESLKSNPKAAELNRLLQDIAWQAVTSHQMSGVKAVPPPEPDLK